MQTEPIAQGPQATQATQATQSPPAAPGPKPKKRIVLRVILAILAVLALALGAVAVFHEPILRHLIQREARARGVELEFGTMLMGSGWLRLGKVHLTLEDVWGLEVDIETARVNFTGILAPDITSIDARGVTARAQGSIADRALELSVWSKEHPEAFRIPVTASDVRADWREKQGAPPWLAVSGGALVPFQGGVTFSAKDASLSGVAFGPALAAWTADASTISLGFGKASPADAPIRIDIRPKPLPSAVDIILKPVTMAELGSPLGLTLPTDKATIEGTVKLALGKDPMDEDIAGNVAMTLRGWVPPHPKELGGIVFGSATTFTSAFQILKDRKRVTLSDAAVAAGAFKLKGAGVIDRKGDYGVATMDMKGNIPCADVARSATAANFGDAAGAFVGDVAKMALSGSVAVSVHIEADTRDLRNPRIRNDVGVGCGIKGLPGIKLPAPGDLPKLPEIPMPEIPLPEILK
jgi:hypothetical protein